METTLRSITQTTSVYAKLFQVKICKYVTLDNNIFFKIKIYTE